MLKQRLVGAAVLIALGVIFIPMLLTGEGDFLSGEMESNIPPKPMYEIKAPKVVSMDQSPGRLGKTSEPAMEPVPSEVANNKSEMQASAVPATEAKPSEQDNPAGTSTGSSAEKKDQSAKVDSSEVVKVETSKVAKVSEPSVSNPPVSKPPVSQPKIAPKATKAPIVSGWVVQLGSFSVERNAKKLRDRLRKKGHASFVEEYTRNGKTSYRVRIGPELTRDLANSLKQKLKTETKIEGLVISFPGK